MAEAFEERVLAEGFEDGGKVVDRDGSPTYNTSDEVGLSCE
jgi:hypothetical protein